MTCPVFCPWRVILTLCRWPWCCAAGHQVLRQGGWNKSKLPWLTLLTKTTNHQFMVILIFSQSGEPFFIFQLSIMMIFGCSQPLVNFFGLLVIVFTTGITQVIWWHFNWTHAQFKDRRCSFSPLPKLRSTNTLSYVTDASTHKLQRHFVRHNNAELTLLSWGIMQAVHTCMCYGMS